MVLETDPFVRDAQQHLGDIRQALRALLDEIWEVEAKLEAVQAGMLKKSGGDV